MTAILEKEPSFDIEEEVPNFENKEFERERNTGTPWLRKYRRPEWQKRSPVWDVFCRYGGYYS